MVTRTYRAPLLRGALSTGIARRRAEKAATHSRAAAWLTPTPAPVPPGPASTPPAAGDVVAHLSRLVELAEPGVLTTPEFTAARARILRRGQRG
jgi:hypothetical protein